VHNGTDTRRRPRHTGRDDVQTDYHGQARNGLPAPSGVGTIPRSRRGTRGGGSPSAGRARPTRHDCPKRVITDVRRVGDPLADTRR
jgi:hypothetical protein